MERDFWDERWSAGRIAFHQRNGHPRLPNLLDGVSPGRVLVPLAGKTFDIRVLHDHGHDVVAVEFIDTAIRAFAEEHRELGLRIQDGPLGIEARGDRLRFLASDFFRVDPDLVGRFDTIYDRAALVALPAPDRQRYVAHLRRLLAETGQVLMFVFEYDPAEMDGPPFSVTEDEVRALYQGAQVDLLDTADVFHPDSPLAERGLTALTERTYRITGAAQ